MSTLPPSTRVWLASMMAKGNKSSTWSPGPVRFEAGVVEGVVGQGVAPVAGAIHRQRAVNALQGGLAGVPVDEDGLAVAEVQRARGVQAEIDPQVRQGAGRGQQGEPRAGAVAGLASSTVRSALPRERVLAGGSSGGSGGRGGCGGVKAGPCGSDSNSITLLADEAAGRREVLVMPTVSAPESGVTAIWSGSKTTICRPPPRGLRPRRGPAAGGAGR